MSENMDSDTETPKTMTFQVIEVRYKYEPWSFESPYMTTSFDQKFYNKGEANRDMSENEKAPCDKRYIKTPQSPTGNICSLDADTDMPARLRTELRDIFHQETALNLHSSPDFYHQWHANRYMRAYKIQPPLARDHSVRVGIIPRPAAYYPGSFPATWKST